MTETRAIISAREELYEALQVLDEADTKIQALAPETPDEEREFHKASFERAEKLVAHAREKLERQIAIQLAKEAVPPALSEEDEERAVAGGKKSIQVTEPLTYRKDNQREHSFLRDVAHAYQGDPHAQERLRRHEIDTRKELRDWERRDVTAAGGAAGFVPPLYMGQLWAEYPRENRPFADIVQKMDLPAAGNSITIPRLTTGTAVAVQQTEADAPQETDADETTLTVGVRLIAGQQDLSLQAFERTEPGFDQVVLSDLRAACDPDRRRAPASHV
jgi:HK97 family phage major capsid protein